jgi:Cytochrome c/Cytochrome c7 and related cytochrome c/Class III cytochrome C family
MLLKRICWVFTLVIATSFSLLAEPTKEAGKELFSANCASCHAKDMKTASTGPALGGVEERWSAFPRKDLYSWIRNSQALIATGHPYATELWAKYKPVLMSSFPGLTDEQIESILLYVKDPGGPVVTADPGTDTKPEESGLPWMFIGLASVLLLLAFALMRIVNNLQNVTRVREGLPPVEKSIKDILTTKGAIAFFVFALILIFGYKTVDNAVALGREQNYQPDQPINFSHKIHAGDNKIDCQYCHDTARRSKHASIPATNTCMNCHAAIKKGTISGTKEITKIFASIGYDPTTNQYISGYDNWSEKQIEELYKKWIRQEYVAANSLTAIDDAGKTVVENEWEGIVKALRDDTNGKIQGPIEWVRIHNLPDHAYFNHAQHVSVGKVECQKCHGKIEEMDVVYQYSTLGMGWCISCHNQTEVKFKDNPFYKQYNEEYIKFHKKKVAKPESEMDKVFVADIGGLECQKCHY